MDFIFYSKYVIIKLHLWRSAMKDIFYLLILIPLLLISGCSREVTITFKENGGISVSDVQIKSNETIELPTTKREGYTFVYWKDNKGNSYHKNASFKNDVVLYAVWKIEEYEVVFIGDNEEVLSRQTIKFGKGAVSPDIPNKAGYTFIGWDKDFEEIKSNIEIRAIFDEVTEGLEFTFDIDSYIVTGYLGKSKIVKIPERYRGMPVVKIGDKAFKNNQFIEKVILPETIKIIGDKAFYHCENLNVINLDMELDKIGEFAFALNYRLLDVNVNAKIIGVKAFYDCIFLDNISLGRCVEVLDNLAFENCNSLEYIYIPDNIKEINDGVFNWCQNLKEIQTSIDNLENLKDILEKSTSYYTYYEIVGIPSFF